MRGYAWEVECLSILEKISIYLILPHCKSRTEHSMPLHFYFLSSLGVLSLWEKRNPSFAICTLYSSFHQTQPTLSRRSPRGLGCVSTFKNTPTQWNAKRVPSRNLSFKSFSQSWRCPPNKVKSQISFCLCPLNKVKDDRPFLAFSFLSSLA